jgi:ABC-2 type transport system ATP-binding protein
VPDEINGAGTVDLTIDRFLLLPGTYDLSASLVDYSNMHVFDSHQRSLRFDVDPGDPHESFGGVVSLGGRWQVRPGE